VGNGVADEGGGRVVRVVLGKVELEVEYDASVNAALRPQIAMPPISSLYQKDKMISEG